jgi:aminopeptidase N
MGDAAFLNFLGALAQRYRYRAITTAEFQQTAAEFLPKSDPDPTLELFFDQWVHSTGIPSLSLRHQWKAGQLTLTLTQSGVDPEFGVDVPVEIRTAAGQRPLVKWLRTSNEPAVLLVPLARPPQRVELQTRSTLQAP